VREVSGTSMVLAACDWDLAAASLRFVAKTQLASGDVPKIYNMRRDRRSHEFESDNELWFVLGCCESIAMSGRTELLDEVCSFWDQGEGTIWEHIKRAFYWVRDQVGTGRHGLILIRDGDWNDYLSLMGAEGRGESVVNSGTACRGFGHVLEIARRRGEASFAHEVEIYLANLQTAVAAAFDQGWFRRGYTDNGKPVGSYAENRVFLNAQTWAVLGKCGTAEQRRMALKNAIKHCHTDIGLTLMSRPYSSPAPDDISWCAIPAGEGENAGIWPQTIHWFVWALTEEGLLEEALAEWKCGTLHRHACQFPEVPYGIFNGPDCFSSKWSGKREGWTQSQLLNRAQFVPINPMIAWQGFTLRKINEALQK
jgi:cellobiose phosphorylase